MLTNAIAVANGKGGVGKTSLTANVGGMAALSGWRVLLVDLDPQGNLGTDLGYEQDGRGDEGGALLRAVVGGAELAPLREVRPHLDVVPGGQSTEELEALLGARRSRDRSDAVGALVQALGPLASQYQLILVDCPPSSGPLTEAALVAVRHLVIPTKGDAGSLNGLAKMARMFERVRSSDNPELELLGVVLFDFGAGDRRIVAKARGQLEEALAGAAPVLSAFVRNSRRAADDMREPGLLAYEYEQAATEAKPWYEDRDGPRFSAAAGGLAGDYQRITEELLAMFSARAAELVR
jgi:cellulose biosynthesis protein BcsQ